VSRSLQALERAARAPNARRKASRFKRANYASAYLSLSKTTQAGLGSIGKFLSCFTFDLHAYQFFRGCVTPQQIENVNSEIDDDVMNLDGYEELPEDIQEKVARAFKQGHVDDDDWNGVCDSSHFCFH
jgi:hypothetical protein